MREESGSLLRIFLSKHLPCARGCRLGVATVAASGTRTLGTGYYQTTDNGTDHTQNQAVCPAAFNSAGHDYLPRLLKPSHATAVSVKH